MATTMPSRAPSRRRHGVAAVVAAAVWLLCLACSAEAQQPSGPSPPAPSSYPNGWNATRFNPSMAIIIVVLISAFFFMGFFSIYLRQCSERADRSVRPAGAPGARSRRAAAARGLDPAVIQTFPTLVYADVKEHKIGKGALECAVCLSEFEDDDTLRLLPKCDHVFHPDCIDAWLSAHTTCPVCRANLCAEPIAAAAAPESVPSVLSAAEDANAAVIIPNPAAVDGAGGDQRHTQGAAENSALATIAAATGQPDHVAITIDVPPAPPEAAQKKAESSAAPSPTGRTVRVESKSRLPWRSRSSLRPPRFPRSHSTGHSLTVVRPGEDCERYTLRLPDHIRRDIMAGKLQRSSSCAAFPAAGEGSARKGGGFVGEGSSRGGGGSIGGRSFKLRKWEWMAKSDRWAFFARTFSMRTSRVDVAAAEGSTRRWADGGDARAEGSVKPKKSPFDCLGSGAGTGGANEGGAFETAAAVSPKPGGPTRV